MLSKKAILQVLFLLAAVMMIGYGAWRGVGGLLFVPIFKAVTGLPPYLGMLISLGVLWVFTELVYDHKQNMEESIKNRVSKGSS